jgi:hypothetical protein
MKDQAGTVRTAPVQVSRLDLYASSLGSTALLPLLKGRDETYPTVIPYAPAGYVTPGLGT